jgi:hypothetical protein
MATIPTRDLPTIKDRVAKVNRRAEKLGVEGVSLELGEPYTVTERDDHGVERVTEMVEVEVVGPVVQLEGWTFLAAIDHREGLVRTSPTHEVDGIREYADRNTCEHCGTDRARLNTFVLGRSDNLDERIQVGSTCIKDFLGHHVSLWVFEASADLAADLDAWEDGGGFDGYSLVDFLSITAGVIRNHGWVSRGKARESYDERVRATADEVNSYLTARHEDIREALIPGGVTEADRELAKAAIVWAEDLEAENDYLYNVRTVADNGFVTWRSGGIAASIISAYQRAEGRRIERETEAAEASPVPVTDERIVITGVIVKVDFKEGFGYYDAPRKVIIVKDDRGFKVWGSAPKPLHGAEQGDRVTFTAAVEVSDRDETFGFFKRPTKAAAL